MYLFLMRYSVQSLLQRKTRTAYKSIQVIPPTNTILVRKRPNTTIEDVDIHELKLAEPLFFLLSRPMDLLLL